jgi:hypothetical protein
MADLTTYEGSPLYLKLFLVDGEGVPVTIGCSVKLRRNDGKFFTGTSWSSVETSLTMVSVLEGYYEYVVPGEYVTPANFTAIYIAENTGGSMENIQVVPVRSIRTYGAV